MSDARWTEIDVAITSAVRHFTAAGAIFDTCQSAGDGLQAYLAEMGFMHAMQSAHTSLEAALVAILTLFGEEPPPHRRPMAYRSHPPGLS